MPIKSVTRRSKATFDVVLGEYGDRRLIRAPERRRDREHTHVPQHRPTAPERAAHLPGFQHQFSSAPDEVAHLGNQL